MAVTIATFNAVPTHRDQNSYAGVARADLYFAERPNSGNWTGVAVTDNQKAQAMITATRAIESLTFRGAPYTTYNDDQRLHFPAWLEGRVLQTANGTADSADATTLVDAALSGDSYRQNDFWNYGAVRITGGTGASAANVKEVTDFVASTGTVTVADWETTPDDTSQFELVEKIPDDIFIACMEIAYGYMPNADTGIVDDGGRRANLQSQGVKSFSVGNHSESFGDGAMFNGYKIPLSAMTLLNKYTGIVY